ncbi:acylneuraminate cytidylyltransferase [Micropruina sonneratiae]|uniref:acylneuraminate cytidylyltransferase n=1 Tax=Micropruina sonneratiae TaxID=2986940 RepID=UPI002225C47C|nr:acylneuraminate cytidylyltransferase [Micropruina sp. KQZ13P-5]MCW3156431.1 acylneuraminate cytidylyltransferase [Micropruina sp. KQZ13P-5]
MTVLAVIPARGGSKGVPGKNLVSIGGVPLVVRAIRAAQASGMVDVVAVSTDDDRIAAVAGRAGALVIGRPAALAGDEASSEAALLHALDEVEDSGLAVEVLLMVQCTSPFVTAAEIADCVAAVRGGADTAFTAAPSHGFLWRRCPDGSATGVNHDQATRPRRQDRRPEFLETGAVYAMTASGFERHRHRFFGRTVLIEADPARVLEIDEPADLDRARLLAPLLDGPSQVPGRADIDAVVLDFDGTQTDDSAQVASDGSEQVRVHRGDGLGIAALRRAGIPVLILSSEANPVVRARARKLNVPVLHGVADKGSVLRDWCSSEAVDPGRVLYAGNDVNDLGCFALVGWPVAVASAHPVVRDAARLVTSVPGGHGAVREIATWILGKELIP